MLFNKKKKKNHFKIQHEFSDRCSKHGIYTLPGGVRQRYRVTDIGL